MNEEEKKKFYDALDNAQKIFAEASKKYDKEADAFWNGLSYDERLMAFYSVCKRIWQGDVIDEGSYRYVLYDTFGFGMDAYGIGMQCHYMDLHNLIITGMEHDEYIKEVKKFYDKDNTN